MKRTLISLLSHLAPRLMVNMAHHQLNNPQVLKLREHEEDVLQTAQQSQCAFKGFQIQLYHWQGAGPKVMLVHGWEGQAGNFADMIEALLAKGFNVVAFDGPSHGHSSKGATSPIDFCELVGILLDRYQPQHLISHSFGGVPTSLALSQRPTMQIQKYVMLTTPDRFMDRIEQISQQVGVSTKVRDLLIEKLRSEVDMPLESINVSDFVAQMQVQAGLMLHDRDDRLIPLQVSERVQACWPNSRLEVVEGTGHFRILRTAAVIDRVVGFLQG